MKHSEYVRDVINGDTAVLFIHGILGTPNHFQRFISLIPENWAVHNILLDGHGKTVRDFSKSSMEKWKKNVSDRLDYLTGRYENIIIVAHSMGTLFAIKESIRNPSQVKLLFLLAAPLKIFVKPSAVLNSFKVIFKISGNDEVAIAAKESYSVEPSWKIWEYAGWIPRYMEFFKEVSNIRGLISDIKVPCVVYQSYKDELVARSSCKYLNRNPSIKINMLSTSRHFYYTEDDYEYLLSDFKRLCSKYHR